MLGIRKAAAVVLPMLAAPLLLAACATTGAVQAEPSPSATSPWLWMTAGSVAPSPATSFTPRARPAAATLSPTVAPPAGPTPSRSPSCGTAGFKGGAVDGMTVTPGSTSAVVTWFNPGGDDLVDYRITAVSQHLVVGAQPETPGWTTVTPSGCGWMTATVTGLTPGTPYVFSADLVRSRKGMDGTWTRTVARSGVVSTT
ncbi:fibronectin type III domain-containing protein [Actinoplanes oblitus]|uniref:Fibronectin type III domain-containing protein n=1 Tax=Actinoplanes oblitus TaxID=3040509 RepID=A0ABY8WBJ8_9ACTN|nr:fibronectin type III domain-containing protein [Actinoplanes oblitus]WIM94852.1 fibronectin type III domain-containing protein [Actinoplanes oblitus]